METKLQHQDTDNQKAVSQHADGWSNSPGDRLYEEVSDAVWMVLERNEVNARKRRIIWSDGQKLTIKQTINRIQPLYPHYPIDLIETSLIEWLETGYAPDTHSDEQIEELGKLINKWIQAYQR